MKMVKITSHRNPSLIGQHAFIISQGEHFKNTYRVALRSQRLEYEYVGTGCFEYLEDRQYLSISIDNNLLLRLMTQSSELGISIDEHIENILRETNDK